MTSSPKHNLWILLTPLYWGNSIIDKENQNSWASLRNTYILRKDVNLHRHTKITCLGQRAMLIIKSQVNKWSDCYFSWPSGHKIKINSLKGSSAWRLKPNKTWWMNLWKSKISLKTLHKNKNSCFSSITSNNSI